MSSYSCIATYGAVTMSEREKQRHDGISTDKKSDTNRNTLSYKVFLLDSIFPQ